MSKQSLDDRLAELVAILRGEGAVSSNEEAVKELATSFGISPRMTPVEERVGQIKQAFTDDGYVRIRPEESLAPKSFIAFHSGLKDGARNCMTGQTWYDRFENEAPGSTEPHVLEAAKRAAGLQEAE